MPDNPMPNDRGSEHIDGFTVDRQGVHLDSSAVEAVLLSKASKQTVNEDEPNGPEIEGESETIEGAILDKNGFHLDKDDLFANLLSSMKNNPVSKTSTKGAKKSAEVDFGELQPIWEDLQEIPFSDNYQHEIKLIREAIKKVSHDIKVNKIIENTKMLAKNAQKFYQSDDGMRVIFSVLGNKFSMRAKGSFTGQEAFYLQVNGDTLDGVVLRKNANGDFSDVTKNYKIEITRSE